MIACASMFVILLILMPVGLFYKPGKDSKIATKR
jgi:hypothetical protein